MPSSPEVVVKRRADVFRMRMEDKTWQEVADALSISPRQARYDYRAFIENDFELPNFDPLQVVDDLLRGFQADLWEFSEAADAAWEDNNISNVIGAVRSRMDARVKTVELLQATGRLPKNLGTLRVERDVRYMIEVVVGVFDEFNVPSEAKKALMERLQPAALEPAA